MLRFNIGSYLKVPAVVVVLAMMTGSPRAGTALEPTYLPDGTWVAIGTMGNIKLPFMDTYASLQNQHGLTGTVVCTLTLALRSPLPLGPDGAPISVTVTQAGHGNWTRVEKNVYAFTAWRILVGPDGKAVGWMRFWGSISPDAPDHFLGEINAGFYTLDFVALQVPSLSATTEGWRVAVERE